MVIRRAMATFFRSVGMIDSKLGAEPGRASRRLGCGVREIRRNLCGRLGWFAAPRQQRSEEHTSELQSQSNLVCRLLLEKKKKQKIYNSSENRNNRRGTREH